MRTHEKWLRQRHLVLGFLVEGDVVRFGTAHPELTRWYRNQHHTDAVLNCINCQLSGSQDTLDVGRCG